MESQRLPYNTDSVKDKKNFYICLIEINAGFSRFKRKIPPTKITHIDDSTYQPYLVDEKGKKIKFTILIPMKNAPHILIS